MEDLIQVFRMTEIAPKKRAEIIIKLGNLINHQYAANVTEPLVYELVKLLDPDNEILVSPRYAPQDMDGGRINAKENS